MNLFTARCTCVLYHDGYVVVSSVKALFNSSSCLIVPVEIEMRCASNIEGLNTNCLLHDRKNAKLMVNGILIG